MSERFEPFRCQECGGTVRLLPPAGQTWEFRRGFPVAIPEDVLIPRCDGCGETYLSEADEKRVQTAVRKVYLDEQTLTYARCVAELRAVHGATLREIENVCGVTPTYFSHVMKGRRVASTTLTRLVEAFVAAPAEFERHLAAIRPAEPKVAARVGLHGTVQSVGRMSMRWSQGPVALRGSRSQVPPALRGSA